MYEGCWNLSPLHPPGQLHVTYHRWIYTSPQLLIQFPKMAAPILAGMLTFYPDSKHRTSVNPSAAPRLSHVRADGKRKKKTGAGACWSSKPLVPMDRE